MNFAYTLILAFFAVSVLMPATAFAKLSFEDNAFPEFITSARALAMGNAYINKVDDSWSAFYNPAGLGTVRKPQLHLFNAHMEANNGMLNLVGNGPFTDTPQKYLDSFDADKLRSALKSEEGKLAHSRFQAFPNITVRGLTLGYMYAQRNRAIIDTKSNNDFDIAERKDQGPVMALNASFFGGVFKIGASAVYLTRQELNKTFKSTDNVDIRGSDYRYGKGLQVTAGARVVLPVALLPTFSAVLRNATNNDFEAKAKGGLPDSIKQTVDLGISITPQLGQITRLHLEANLKDSGNAYDTDIKRRLAAGAELDFNRRLFIRGGWGDGWGSGGIGVRSRTFILDLTTYAVDRSLDGFRKMEDRRWVFSISSGF